MTGLTTPVATGRRVLAEFSGVVLLLGAVLDAVVGEHSTGEPGGVGRGTVDHSPDAKTVQSLDGAALASYLRDLRTDVTAYEEAVAPKPDAERTIPRIDDGVEIVELNGRLRTTRPLAASSDEVEVIDRKTHDGEVTDRKTHDSEVTDRKTHDGEVTDRKTHDGDGHERGHVPLESAGRRVSITRWPFRGLAGHARWGRRPF